MTGGLLCTHHVTKQRAKEIRESASAKVKGLSTCIIKIKPKRLVYVSCDLMTLARDLNILSEFFNIIELTPVDMFPQTSHVEAVVCLRWKD